MTWLKFFDVHADLFEIEAIPFKATITTSESILGIEKFNVRGTVLF